MKYVRGVLAVAVIQWSTHHSWLPGYDAGYEELNRLFPGQMRGWLR